MHHLAELFDEPSRRAAVIGGVLVILALVLLGFTEHAARLGAMAEDALGGFVRTGAAATPGPDANGQLVLATGAPVVGVPATDPQFGISVAAPALLRRVEMFQWHETRVAGEARYGMDWFDHPIDSTAFAKPAGHVNPGAFPIASARFDSPDVKVGGFRLAPQLVRLIAGPAPVTPDFARLAPNMAATFTVQGDALVTSNDPAHPRVGDLRVSFEEIAPRALTILARDRDGTLEPTHDAAGGAVAEVLIGRLPLADVLPGAPRPPRFAWARRVLAVLLAWAGVALLLPGPRRHDRVLALALAVVPLAALAAAYWFAARTLPAAILIALAVLAAVVAGWRWRGRQGATARH